MPVTHSIDAEKNIERRNEKGAVFLVSRYYKGSTGRIYRLGSAQFSVPGVETPGYFRQSLRDAISRISPP